MSYAFYSIFRCNWASKLVLVVAKGHCGGGRWVCKFFSVKVLFLQPANKTVVSKKTPKLSAHDVAQDFPPSQFEHKEGTQFLESRLFGEKVNTISYKLVFVYLGPSFKYFKVICWLMMIGFVISYKFVFWISKTKFRIFSDLLVDDDWVWHMF